MKNYILKFYQPGKWVWIGSKSRIWMYCKIFGISWYWSKFTEYIFDGL